MKQYTLMTDKNIWDGRKRVLLKKGTITTLICWHGDVAILEYNGKRFSAREETITINNK